MPIADDPSHLGLEMSDFLFVPGDDPYGSTFADQPFDELSTNISGGAGYKNHWCSPFRSRKLVLVAALSTDFASP